MTTYNCLYFFNTNTDYLNLRSLCLNTGFFEIKRKREPLKAFQALKGSIFILHSFLSSTYSFKSLSQAKIHSFSKALSILLQVTTTQIKYKSSKAKRVNKSLSAIHDINILFKIFKLYFHRLHSGVSIIKYTNTK